jgi:hypothetical protein
MYAVAWPGKTMVRSIASTIPPGASALLSSTFLIACSRFRGFRAVYDARDGRADCYDPNDRLE